MTVVKGAEKVLAACPQAGDPISIHCGPLLLWVGG